VSLRTLRLPCPGVNDTPRTHQVLARVRAIPPGFVRTYDLPWHRVVRADGSLAKGARQRRLLEEEGIPFKGDRVDMRAARLPD
jgi:methylated-DNA-protein-cysteine methyltransferase-like protein